MVILNRTKPIGTKCLQSSPYGDSFSGAYLFFFSWAFIASE